ncbi:MAG: DUF362 domain-containing protein [candidate division WOR-3 bacterium]
MSAIVYFIPPQRINKANLQEVFIRTNFLKNFYAHDRIGIKLHFGEENNYNYLNPQYVKTIVEIVKSNQLQPSLIETSTLYRGARQNRTSHIKLAYTHGFSEIEIGAPIEIVDGERGEEFELIKTDFSLVKYAKIAKGINTFQGLVNLAHYKGHFVVGFGGVLKNIAMGLAAKGGKLQMHSQTKPYIKQKICKKCRSCVGVCPNDAIVITANASVISEKCIGCASCIEVCSEKAIQFNWNEASSSIMKKMAEYAWAILHNRKCLHFNFAVKITPNCDCMNMTENPIISDLGVFASLDPVAADMAVWERTKDNIYNLYPSLNPELLLDYAEAIGLGAKGYQLIELP